MKSILLICTGLFVFSLLFSQEQKVKRPAVTDKTNIAIRPNSRDYSMIRLGNNAQRMVQIRRKALARHKKAVMNRKQAIQRRRNIIIMRSARQRRIQQQRIQQRRRMIQHHQRMKNR